MNKEFIDKINQTIKELFNWKKDELYPLFYSHNQFNKKAEILFIWMNPAGTEKSYYKIWKWFTDKKIQSIVEENENFFEYEPYYWIYKKLFKKWNKSNWNIIDLYVIRWTNQHEIMQKKKDDEAFFKKQYNDIFLPLLTSLKPKIIVVTNAKASSLLNNLWYWKEKKINKNWYWILPKEIQYENSEKTKVIFTSMLSGQRAMDIYTREILKWHIKELLKEF